MRCKAEEFSRTICQINIKNQVGECQQDAHHTLVFLVTASCTSSLLRVRTASSLRSDNRKSLYEVVKGAISPMAGDMVLSVGFRALLFACSIS